MLWHVALQRTTGVEIMARTSAGWTIVAFAEQGQGMTFSNKKGSSLNCKLCFLSGVI